MISLLAALFVLCTVSSAFARHAVTGARGFKHTYNNRYYSWMPLSPPYGGNPNYRCHVVRVVDGSLWGGWGGAQADYGAGWIELKHCTYIETASSVRVNSWSRLVVQDPRADQPIVSGAQQDGEACNCELQPGQQVWVLGPEEPGMPPGEAHSPAAAVVADTTGQLPVEFVMDYEDGSLVTRITNCPWSAAQIWARGLIAGGDTSEVPMLPGESLLYTSTGEIDGSGHVLVKSLGDVSAEPGDEVVLEFEVWNLDAFDHDFDLTVEDAHGWQIVAPGPVVTVPAMGSTPVLVPVTVPPSPEGPADGVHLEAVRSDNPQQYHGDTGWVEAQIPVPSGSDRSYVVLAVLLLGMGALLLGLRRLRRPGSRPA